MVHLFRDSVIDAQMEVLNNNFAKTGFSFDVVNVDRTVNADWFNDAVPDSAQQNDMKSALHQGGPAALNIYTVG